MNGFSLAAAQADQTRQPVARGISVKVKTDMGERAEALKKRLEREFVGGWTINLTSYGWIDAECSHPIPLDRAWEVIGQLLQDEYLEAEPILLVRMPSPESPDAQPSLGLWGVPYSAEQKKTIADVSKDHRWSLKKMKVLEAWEQCRAKGIKPGQGILIAHLDTGYTDHPQLAGIYSGTGFNFVEPNNDARDLLNGAFGGHGTGTASVIASRDDDGDPNVFGTAPAAVLLPMRVSTSVVHFDFGNVAKAIDQAVLSGAHVVSMSLGGPNPFGRIRDAIQNAFAHGVIIVSAAGNVFPFVVYPAAFPGVVSMAACNPADIPWNGSAFGAKVTATAPGEAVWKAEVSVVDGKVQYSAKPWNGTSFATAGVAGIAALWLSYHGRDKLVKDYGESFLPFAFHWLLCETADGSASYFGSGHYGKGVVDANAILKIELPERADVIKYREKIMGGHPEGESALNALASFFAWRPMTGFEAKSMSIDPESMGPKTEEILSRLLAGAPEENARAELRALILTVSALRIRFGTLLRDGATPSIATSSLARTLLTLPLSPSLRTSVEKARADAIKTLVGTGEIRPPMKHVPPFRRLRAFSFDPSYALSPGTETISRVTIAIPWEDGLVPGPIGEYLEVVDVDPATDCVYQPVDLNDPALLAQDGLPPSQGNPQFHQQMVYAVAMKTIQHFEIALGRPIFWAPLRPWLNDTEKDSAEARFESDGTPDRHDQFVQRLRIYPHALREANAYYSPQKRALLFGYFPARPADPGEVYPGGIVFTCLSHDVVAHETTHALIDGMHAWFTEPTNPDVYAFHEAFADIVALFQHFTYPEVLESQIAQTGGRLTARSELGTLAKEFGKSTGGRSGLREALGNLEAGPSRKVTENGPAGTYKTEREDVTWQRYRPDAKLLENMDVAGEAHHRGSILVTAVFDAFLSIYGSRTADLLRIAKRDGHRYDGEALPAELTKRMAYEASKSAEHVLRICIRALDYTPPVDITFGEFLRGLITADFDLVPNDDRGYRTAFINAFRSWGIYPRDVRTLSHESLLWQQPDNVRIIDPAVGFLKKREDKDKDKATPDQILQVIKNQMANWKPGARRKELSEMFGRLQGKLSLHISALLQPGQKGEFSEMLRDVLLLKDTNGEYIYRQDEPGTGRLGKPVRVSVSNLKPARRVGPRGEFLTEMVFEITRSVKLDGTDTYVRGGMTLIVDMDDWTIRYAICKRFANQKKKLQADRTAPAEAPGFGAAEYRCGGASPGGDRSVDLEAMRVDSCTCRTRRGNSAGAAEPFAMLHRNRPSEEN